MKMACKNDIVKNLDTAVSKNKIKVSLFNPIGLGYDGCGTHTHGYASSDKIQAKK